MTTSDIVPLTKHIDSPLQPQGMKGDEIRIRYIRWECPPEYQAPALMLVPWVGPYFYVMEQSFPMFAAVGIRYDEYQPHQGIETDLIVVIKEKRLDYSILSSVTVTPDDRKGVCPKCDGKGRMPCPYCRGTKKRRKWNAKDRREREVACEFCIDGTKECECQKTQSRNVFGSLPAPSTPEQIANAIAVQKSIKKEQPAMTEEEVNKFFPRDEKGQPVSDEQIKTDVKESPLDLTHSPDEPTSPNVKTQPAPQETVKPADAPKPADPIGELKKHLFKLLATQFTDETDEQIAARMKVALKADNFKDFIVKYSPIEKAREYGQAMVDEYLERNAPKQPAMTTPVPSEPNLKLVTGNPFQPATDDDVYLKMAIAGPSGSGKSYTSLKVATEMFPDGKIAFLCTEHKAARRYAKHFKFDLMEISDYHPNRFIEAIHAAERFGYDVLIIDSLSHEWSGSGGLLSLVDGKFGGWKEATPLHQKLIETIQEANIHIIVTMRSKMSYQVEQGNNGKQIVRKMGLEPIQRDQTEYEFDIYAEIDMGSEVTISKSRCFDLKAGALFLQGNGLAPVLKKWVA